MSSVAAHDDGVQLCWLSKLTGSINSHPGLQRAASQEGKAGGAGRRRMLSTNKPRVSHICGKNSYNILSNHLELLFQDCFHCLWLQGSKVALLHCMGHEPRCKVHSLTLQNRYQEGISHPPQGVRQVLHQKQKPPCSRNWVNYTGFLHSCLWLGSDTGIWKEHFFGDYLTLWKGFGAGCLGCPQPGFPLKGCWHRPRTQPRRGRTRTQLLSSTSEVPLSPQQ